jgi:hypothetical protein
VWPLSAKAQLALVQSHRIKLRATAYGSFGTLEFPISGGGMTCDSKSQVRRTAQTTTNLGLWPRNPRAVLAPLGTEIQVDYGIVLPGGVIEWVPQIRGLLTEATRQRPIGTAGSFPLKLVDRAARVAEDRLTAPSQTVSGALTVVEIRRLIQETLGTGVTVTDRTGSVQVAPILDIERERWADGVEKLADSIAAECYFDPQGNAVIRAQPQITDTPVWTVSSGPGGIMLSKEDTLTRELVYNGVVVFGERADGTAPVTATVWDTDPTSPTYYLGQFGKKPRFYSNPQLTTVLQCQAAGAALLARVKGLNAKVKLTAVVNPALESGDVVRARDIDDGSVQAHILDTVTVPWSAQESQPIESRGMDLPAES